MSAIITIVGNLVRDPELRQNPAGKSVLDFSLGYTPRRPDGSQGETSFYEVTAWEGLADNFAASFKKGDRLMVTGRVSQRRWTDEETNKGRSKLVISAIEIGGTCRFHTVEMSKVARVETSEPVEVEAEAEDIFANN